MTRWFEADGAHWLKHGRALFLIEPVEDGYRLSATEVSYLFHPSSGIAAAMMPGLPGESWKAVDDSPRLGKEIRCSSDLKELKRLAEFLCPDGDDEQRATKQVEWFGQMFAKGVSIGIEVIRELREKRSSDEA